MSELNQQRKANIIEFKDTVVLGLQQEQSLLSPLVETKHYHGENTAILQVFNPTEVSEVPDVKLPPTIPNNTQQDRRWMGFQNYSWAEAVNPFIHLEQNINPFLPYAKSAVAAFKRKQDEVIMRGMLGINKTGKDGEVSESFPEANVLKKPVAKVGSSKGFKDTLAGQILDALVWLSDHDVDIDRERINLALPPSVYREMFDIEQVINRDYVSAANLDAGRVRYFAGVNIVLYKKVIGDDKCPSDIHIKGVNMKDNYYCPVWCSSAVELGIWNKIDVSYDKLPQFHNAQQLLAVASMGAARLEPNKIVCLEVPKKAA